MLCSVGVLGGQLLGCSAYDPERLDRGEGNSAPAVTGLDAATAGSASAGPVNGPDHAGASGPTPDAGRGDAAALPVPGPDEFEPVVQCGDGRVADDEACDVSIEQGEPGACPQDASDCPPLSECGLQALRGSGCEASCVLLPEVCEDDDRCCPSMCTAANDNDCSQSCGDGVVQEEQETCEPGTETPCPTEADCDDGKPCTDDVLLGSAENCNAECSHDPVTQLVDGDGCCPDGANANSDADCEPECGNEIKEEGEACDTDPGCREDCTIEHTPEQLDCLDRFGDDECAQCACISCTQEVFACLDSDDAEHNAQCAAINECALEWGCVGTPCYCGVTACIVAPAGPCVDPILAATTTPEDGDLSVLADRQDPETTIGRALTLGQCRVNNCPDVCP